jgi:hypothetical protein
MLKRQLHRVGRVRYAMLVCTLLRLGATAGWRDKPWEARVAAPTCGCSLC